MTDDTAGAVSADRAATAEHAARLGMVPAGAGIRSVAFAIDAAMWLVLFSPAIVGAVVFSVTADALPAIVLGVVGTSAALVFGFIQLLTHGRRGVTAGKAMTRLRSVSVPEYGRPGFWRVLLRALVLWCSAVLPVLGPVLVLTSGLWDPERRGRSILDRVGRCWLLDVRAGLDPFDAKARRHAERALTRRDDGLDEHLPSMASGVAGDAAMRIPDERSRAGVVGPDGTGARWQSTADASALPMIDEVPVTGAAIPVVDDVPSVTAAVTPAPVTTAAPAVDQVALRTRRSASRSAGTALRFDDGTEIDVPDAGLMGRGPATATGEAVSVLLALDDPQMLLSKTHIAFGQDAGGVWVIDRGSRNGTTVHDPAGAVTTAVAGERMMVPAGWAVHIGGRSFEVVARGADR